MGLYISTTIAGPLTSPRACLFLLINIYYGPNWAIPSTKHGILPQWPRWRNSVNISPRTRGRSELTLAGLRKCLPPSCARTCLPPLNPVAITSIRTRPSNHVSAPGSVPLSQRQNGPRVLPFRIHKTKYSFDTADHGHRQYSNLDLYQRPKNLQLAKLRLSVLSYMVLGQIILRVLIFIWPMKYERLRIRGDSECSDSTFRSLAKPRFL